MIFSVQKKCSDEIKTHIEALKNNKREMTDGSNEDQIFSKLKQIQPLMIDQIHINSDFRFESELSDFEMKRNNFQSDRFEIIQFKKNNHFHLSRENSIQLTIHQNQFLNHSVVSLQNEKIHEEIHDFLLHKKKGKILKPDLRQQSEFYIPDINSRGFKVSKKEKLAEKIRMQSIILENNKIVSFRIPKNQAIFSDSITQYYEKIFSVLESNLNPSLQDLFFLHKSEVMIHIHDIPPKFPFARGVEVNKSNIKKLKKYGMIIIYL